jgi:hypothetical protein
MLDRPPQFRWFSGGIPRCSLCLPLPPLIESGALLVLLAAQLPPLELERSGESEAE